MHIYIYTQKSIYLDAISCISSPPTSSLPSPSHGRTGVLCPPPPYLPLPPTYPPLPKSTSHKWHRRIDQRTKRIKDANLESGPGLG